MSIEVKTWEWVAETPRGLGGAYPQLVAVPEKHLYLKRGASLSWQALDLEKKSWEPKADLPESRDSTGILMDYDSYHKLIWYIPAGGSKSLYAYSLSDDSWRTYPDAPDTIGDGAVILWAGENDPNHLYVIRGSHGADFWRFDISTNKWETMRTIPSIPTSECTGFRKGGKIYVCPNPRIGQILEYDPSIGTWRTKAYTSFYEPAFLTVDDLLVVFTQNLVEIFNANMTKKKILAFGKPPTRLPRPRHPTILGPPFPTTPTKQFAALKNHVYAVTGYGAEGSIFKLEKDLILQEKLT